MTGAAQDTAIAIDGGEGLTRDQVVWCYTTLLLREPETEDVIENFRSSFGDQESLVRFIVQSAEFRERIITPIERRDFSYTDTHEVQEAALLVVRALSAHRPVGARKIRVGRDYDGGYVMVDDFAGLHAAYSLGISDDVSWDLDMAARGLEIYQYDHTIDALPEENRRFHWYRKGVAAQASESFVTLAQILDEHGHRGRDDLLLKCDIEGAEWEVLAGASPSDLRPFRQIVMEVHGFHDLYRTDFRARAVRAVQNLSADHAVVHVHANNNSPYSIVGAVPIPTTLELTLVRRDAFELVPNDEMFPTPLDMPCDPVRADLALGLFRF